MRKVNGFPLRSIKSVEWTSRDSICRLAKGNSFSTCFFTSSYLITLRFGYRFTSINSPRNLLIPHTIIYTYSNLLLSVLIYTLHSKPVLTNSRFDTKMCFYFLEKRQRYNLTGLTATGSQLYHLI